MLAQIPEVRVRRCSVSNHARPAWSSYGPPATRKFQSVAECAHAGDQQSVVTQRRSVAADTTQKAHPDHRSGIIPIRRHDDERNPSHPV